MREPHGAAHRPILEARPRLRPAETNGNRSGTAANRARFQEGRKDAAGRGHRAKATHITVRGARQHNLRRRRRKNPARRDDRLLRPQRLRQNLARDGHDLRRRPAALRRKPTRYARQFVGQMQKPKVDHIDGLSPAIAIEQQRRPHAALDRRHRHRDLRLLPHPLRPPRPAALPRVRHPDRHANQRPDRRQGPPASRRNQAFIFWPPCDEETTGRRSGTICGPRDSAASGWMAGRRAWTSLHAQPAAEASDRGGH